MKKLIKTLSVIDGIYTLHQKEVDGFWRHLQAE
nr:MAG TPA: hypothetical protein [Caudoviricetes sp.]